MEEERLDNIASQKEIDDILKETEEALKGDKKTEQVDSRNILIMWMSSKKYVKALDLLEKQEQTEDVLLNKIECYKGLGWHDKAIPAYENLLRNNIEERYVHELINCYRKNMDSVEGKEREKPILQRIQDSLDKRIANGEKEFLKLREHIELNYTKM